MTVLTIDNGNSTTKAAIWEDNILKESYVMEMPDVEELSRIIETLKPEACILSSVGKMDSRALETLRMFFDGRLVVLTASVPLPLKIKYDSKATLGSDRIAAAAGALSLYSHEGVLVADCGTAITLDVINSTGHFLGGNISPGLSLRFKSLHDSTSCLPLVNEVGPLPTFGTDTLSAIRSGVVEGVLSEIEGAYMRASSAYGVTRMVITGGDAPFLTPLLRQNGLDPVQCPQLVQQGLLYILDYNIRRK